MAQYQLYPARITCVCNLHESPAESEQGILTAVAKFSEKLLEDRKPRLQRFLRTVMLHPEMGRGGVGSLISEWVMSGTTTSAMSKPG
jgi:hypothetical protein